MIGYTLKRLGLALLVALAVSIASFLLLRLSGDVALAIAGDPSSTSIIARTQSAVVAARKPRCEPTPAMMFSSLVRSAEPNEPSSFW